MSNPYPVACKFEKTRIVAHLDHVVHGGCWRVKQSWKLDYPLYYPFRVDEVDENPGEKLLILTTTRPFRNGSYINPAKELRPYITPKAQS